MEKRSSFWASRWQNKSQISVGGGGAIVGNTFFTSASCQAWLPFPEDANAPRGWGGEPALIVNGRG